MADKTLTRTQSRIGCTVSALIFIILAIIPFVACRLIFDGELQAGTPGENHLFVFMLQEPGQEGIGIQRTRVVDEEAGCVRTTVRYFMFDGDAEDAISCSCMEANSAGAVPDGCTISN